MSPSAANYKFFLKKEEEKLANRTDHLMLLYWFTKHVLLRSVINKFLKHAPL